LLPVAEEEEKDEALYSMNDLEVLDLFIISSSSRSVRERLSVGVVSFMNGLRRSKQQRTALGSIAPFQISIASHHERSYYSSIIP
jgi:hypothetical protein